MRIIFFLVGILSFFVNAHSQQLIINEVSQGTGNQEYVEFVVIGNTICENDPIPCIDLRKVIFDDNNGTFAAGAGTGIASGALRFSNDPFWSCIPQGTYILVYNQADPHPLLPPDDISTTDGNCYLVLPANSSLIESTTVSPTTTITTYPPDPQWGPSVGWSPIAMANANDSFMIPDLSNNGVPLHSVSWGNNTNGTIIYFAGAATGLVYSFKNSVDNNPDNQANWVAEPQANGTPGLPNSAANDLWIGTMNPTCRQNALLDLSATTATCGNNNGTASVAVNGISNYSLSWETGSNQNTITGLASGYYTVTVTDNANGCQLIDSVEVLSTANALNVVLNTTNENCSGSCDGNVTVTITGGQAPYSQVWTLNGSPIVLPPSNQFCAGSYAVNVTDNSGCSGNATALVGTNPSSLIVNLNASNENCLGSCDGTISSSIAGGASPYVQTWTLNGSQIAAPVANEFCAGNYQLTVTDNNGCQASASAIVGSDPSSLALTFTHVDESCQGNCDGDVQVIVTGGQAPYNYSWTQDGSSIPLPVSNLFCSGNYEVTVTDENGCQVVGSQLVNTTPLPVISVSNDTLICIRDTIQLTVNASSNVLWSTGETTSTINVTPLQQTIYTVTVTQGNCSANEQIVVSIKNCDTDHSIEFPNVFSPDGDQVNDNFVPIKWENVENISFVILNRWGNEMFSTDNQNISWDGGSAAEGTYFYILKYKNVIFEEFQIHGWFQLVR